MPIEPPSPHRPADPGFAGRARASFERQAAMRTLGVEVVAVEPGQVVLGMAHQPALTQQHGFLHAGVVAAALDTACGFAAFTLQPEGTGVLTIEFKINLLAPAKGPRFRFEATVVKPGRTITVVEGRAWQLAADGAERKLIATMNATTMTVTGRDDVRG